MTIATFPATLSITAQQIHGRLVHPNGDPAGSQRVQLISEGVFFNSTIDTTETNKEGYFTLKHNFSELPTLKSDKETFILRVLEEVEQTKDFLGRIKNDERVVDNLTIKVPQDQQDVELGSLSIDLYAYQKGLPALLQPENTENRPQQWTTDYLLELAQAGFKAILTSKAITTLGVTDLFKIMKLYNAPHNPELSLNGKDTIEMLLNGIHPAYLQKTSEEGIYEVEINWDRYEKDPETPLLINATLKVKKIEDKLEVVSVSVETENKTLKTYHPGEPGYSWALYLFNSMAEVKGQAHFHLGRGHFVSEQNAMAAFKFLNKNNFKHLVGPHLRGVMEIDRVGSKAIFGDESSVLVRSTGLTSKGLYDILKDTLAGTCYSTFRPKQPLCESDRFAKAGNLFWKLIDEATNEFFQKNQANIENNWNEIYYMSKSLVENSLAYRPIEGKKHSVWLDGNEIDNPEFPGRVTINGELKAMRPITLSKEAPETGDVARLKQFARFAIYTSTFWHWVVHASQSKWMTNFSFGSLAPTKEGTVETFGGTSAEHMNQILFLSQLLSKFDDGSITENQHGDIYAGLVNRIKQHEKEFEALGFDINKCFYGTII